MTDLPMRPWRSILKIHPAAELFPQLPPDEMKALGEDIKAHGLQTPIAMWVPGAYRHVGTDHLGKMLLLDGRSRLDACEAVGLAVFHDDRTPAAVSASPTAARAAAMLMPGANAPNDLREINNVRLSADDRSATEE